jgi:Predicted ATP-dependent endonuclease of the OLD family
MNVIIGENNVGKTALVDALRILFSLGPGRRDVYVTPQDLHCSVTGEVATEMRIDAIFEGLSDEEQGAFFELLAATEPPTAQLHVRFRAETVKGQQRLHQTVWGGEIEGQTVGSATHEMVSHMYLGALRDAESDLRPGRGSRLGQLVRRLVTDAAEREQILQHARDANKRILDEKGIQRSADTVNRHLAELAGQNLHQQIRIGFMAPVFERVTESLRPLLPHGGSRTFQAVYDEGEWKQLLAEAGENAPLLEKAVTRGGSRVALDVSALTIEVKKRLPAQVLANILDHMQGGFGVEQNGMGYNNLIYMGVVLGDLVERRKADAQSYNALLIEEPEAHLHPQLQLLVYDFLNRTCVVEPGETRIQVFVTSHSPTLTSRADLDSVVVLHRSVCGALTATAVRNCPLSPTEKQDLKRYLDVTRSQLFFARAVLLVEGISEVLLLPVLAQRLGQRLDQTAIEVVGVSGVSFAPFAKLFNSPDASKRLDIHCSIVTDDDRCSEKNDPNRVCDGDSGVVIATKLQAGEPSARCKSTVALAAGPLLARTACKTLEFELGREAENLPVIAEAICQSGHPRIAERLLREAGLAKNEWERGAIVWSELVGIKAEAAQRLAALLEQESGQQYARRFVVPTYIQEAVSHVANRSES